MFRDRERGKVITTAVAIGALLMHPTAGLAQQPGLPQGPSVVSGNVSVGAPSGGRLTITQGSQRGIVNWQSFSIGQPNAVIFQQPGTSAATLNRVTGGTTSTIAGQLKANGQVFLVNPNGIQITPTGSVKAGGGFVGSTLGISDDDFKAGRLEFFGNGASASVDNHGAISVGRGGFVGLLGGHVSNAGTISVPLGRVGLGSGERATLDLTGDGFLQVAVPTGALRDGALVDVKGRIRARGGQVELKAATVRQAIRDAVNVSGVVSARSVGGRNGRIVLGGGPGGKVRVTGRLKAGGKKGAGKVKITGHAVAVDGGARISADSREGKGGEIAVTAHGAVAVADATVDASGAAGGGKVLVGGDERGSGPLERADETVIGADAVIKADATAKGDGGTVIVWSDSLTTFEGTISARGGPDGGDGGFAEVSGKARLDYRGGADLSAPAGRFGTLLLDPYDIVISAGATSGGAFDGGDPNTFTPSATSVLDVATLISALGAADVIVTTAGPGGNAGNITVAAPIAWAADTTLTLDATNDIAITAPITATGAAAGLALNYGGAYTLGMSTPVTLSGAGSAFSINGDAYTLIRDVSQLQAMQSNLGGRYALAVDIDASSVANFNPVGDNSTGTTETRFTGIFDGLGHTIDGLTINRPAQNYVGLFGFAQNATIRNVGLTDVDIAGLNYVGGLVGWNYASGTGTTASITQAYATGAVTGSGYVGGLVGRNEAGNGATARITQAYATGEVRGSSFVGGLVGLNYASGTGATASVLQAYATGTVTGRYYFVGELNSIDEDNRVSTTILKNSKTKI